MASRMQFKKFFEWYRAREDLENEGLRTDSTHKDSQLEAVRNAIYAMLPGFSDLRVSRSPFLALMVRKGGQELITSAIGWREMHAGHGRRHS